MLLALAACSSNSKPPAKPPPPPAPEVPPANEEEAVVRAVLARFATSPWTMPDAGRLPADAPVPVALDIGGARALGAGAIPPSPRRPLVGKTAGDLQVDADRLGAPIPYIHVMSVDLAGAHAQVMVGVDTARPGDALGGARTGKTCVTLDNYDQQAPLVWAFARHVGATCI